ncbi:hypothetical protein FW774_06455 [Pedobacter sp. BS3]|uniref:hypothetical protein n=1 Tax=Pedobacter sp. BS3 TaxID=2567937 RepID=UPI0011EC9C63|nr:hypothetical protein [Pedobacter sp. BS3]TZF84624.1 hypothetical protein FW774_06455 [Pedobacter sp. BS3]
MKHSQSYLRIAAVMLITALTVLGCSKSKNLAPLDLEKDYFPLTVGSNTVYAVDSTVYNDFNNTVTTYTFELRDSVAQDISENGYQEVRIERYKRKDGTEAWTFQKTISRKLIDVRAEEFIDNQRFVRLVFPPQLSRVWNGNTYNNIGAQEYIITASGSSQTINGISFDQTVDVKEIDENNLVREDYAVATYAKNVGLIRREVKAVDKNISTGQITRGYSYILQIKSF